MRVKKLALKYLVFIVFAAWITACNKPVDSVNPDTGRKTTSLEGIFPHSDSFKKTKLHGESYLNDKGVCLQCHGVDAKGGSSKVSCYTCHSSFPHASNWANPKLHGAAYLKLDAEKRPQCLSCHNTNPENNMFAVNCTTCHAAYPHSEDFTAGMHGDLARVYEGKCTSCHTELKKHMPNNEQGCVGCHTGSLKIHWLEETPDGKAKKGANIFKKGQTSQSSKVHR